MSYLFPRTLEEAAGLLAADGSAKVIAGGTDLVVQIAGGVFAPRTLVDLSRLEALRGIESTSAGVWIGALTTIARIASSPLLPACLAQGARSIGAPPVRTLATIGGNVCNASPCGDTLAPLVALDARFTLVSARGRRQVAAEAFFTGPKTTVLAADEILAGILLPACAFPGDALQGDALQGDALQGDTPCGDAPRGASAFRSIGQREGQAISQVNLAVWWVREGDRVVDLRIAAGAVAPVPLRLRRTEDLLRGRRLSSALRLAAGEGAAREIRPISDVRASAAYRREVIRGLMEDIFEELEAAA